MTYCPLITQTLRIISVRCIPPELEIKETMEINTFASYLDLLLSVSRDCQLRTYLFDKLDGFNFHITKFPFLGSNIPFSLAYGVNISQLIRYARACSSYACFILRAVRLSFPISSSGRDLSRNVWKRLEGSSMVGTGILSNNMRPPLNNVTCHSGGWSYTVTPSIHQTLNQCLTL